MRRVAIALALLLLLCGAALPAHAAPVRDTGWERARFFGQIVNLIGAKTNPAGFTLQLGTQTTDIRIAPKTTFVAKSAEAEVEGLLAGDYASIVTKRVNRLLVAVRIVFDVAPINPMHQFTGTIFRVSLDGRRFVVRLDTGKSATLRLSKLVRIHIEGRPTETPALLLKGEYVQVLAVRESGAWSAYDVTIRASTPERVRR